MKKLKINARQLKQAVALYTSFREKKPRKLKVVTVDIPQVVAVIGYLEYVGYRTTHGNEVQPYHHPFAEGSRPLLCVSSDGRQLVLLGGRYKFTERGIVDRDAKGREIENADHGTDLA